jgi:hypothetical protein
MLHCPAHHTVTLSTRDTSRIAKDSGQDREGKGNRNTGIINLCTPMLGNID